MIVVASQMGNFLYFFIACSAIVQTQNLDTFYHWTAFPALTEILVFMILIQVLKVNTIIYIISLKF